MSASLSHLNDGQFSIAARERPLSRVPSAAGPWQGALLVTATLAALWPVWRWYLLRLNDGSDEPLGLLALITTAILTWPIRSRLTPTTVGTITAATILIFYALTSPALLPLPRAVLALVAVAFAVGLHRAPAGIWGILLFSLPLMASLQFYLNHPLQKITAHGAAFLINLWPDIEVVVRGTLLQWRGTSVAVDPPCSGIKMLWVGGFVHFTLAAYHRHSWKTLAWLSPLALLAMVAANSVRAALLFPKEAGAISLPDWTHGSIGLFVFGTVLALMTWGYAKLAQAAGSTKVAHRPGSFASTALITAAVIAGLTPLLGKDRATAASDNEKTFPGWPAEFEGRMLVERPLSSHEKQFAKTFPGRLGVFDDSDGRRVILRWITRPTRKLHSSAVCLRAAGCTITFDKTKNSDTQWRHFAAQPSDGSELIVREQIFSQSEPLQTWSDMSAWYWAAGANRDAGPWLAVTVIEARDNCAISPPE